ncbi:hypothetical protein B0H19DRAFT_1374105 [Mycena capillaripes]|nr:hypothetical protein B0H19DRAFT_1374105 [Mycena capillaripes]
MPIIPVELLDIIISSLAADDLWILVQVSRAFRQLSLLCLLSKYNISMSQIRSGAVSVPPEALLLVPTIYHIHPIEKLTIVRTNYLRQYGSLCALSRTLGAIPQIPDVAISGLPYVTRASGGAEVIATLSRSGTDPVVIIGMHDVRFVHPKKFPPIRWVDLFPKLTSGEVFAGIVFFAPLIVIFIITVILNLIHMLYRRFLWDQTERIAEALKGMQGSTMRIQTVSGSGVEQFTLVTFPRSQVILNITRRLALSSAQYAAFLATLDLEEALVSLRVWSNCAFNLPGLLSFAHRHPSLVELQLSPGAIDTASLMQEPEVHAHPGHIRSLQAPAAYIPHILPTERCVESLLITSASDPDALSGALAAITVLPHNDARLRQLTLDMLPSPPSQVLPWRTESDIEAGFALPTVTHLTLIVEFTYRAADASDLPRWLIRFPQLQSLEFVRPSVPVAEQATLAQAIAQARVGTSAAAWLGVRFRN